MVLPVTKPAAGSSEQLKAIPGITHRVSNETGERTSRMVQSSVGRIQRAAAILLLLKHLEYVGVAWKKTKLSWTLQAEQEQPPPKALWFKHSIEDKQAQEQIEDGLKLY